jgi:predicted P-loop ATPase
MDRGPDEQQNSAQGLMSVDSVTDGQALIERLKAERAEKLAKATNGKASAVELLHRPEKPKRNLLAVAKPKLEIATPEASAADDGAPVLERTIGALAKLDFTFSYDCFRHRYHVGDHALQQRVGENVEHAILLLRTMIVSRFKFDPGPEKIKAACYRLCLGHAFNPVCDYLDQLEWDGQPRLNTWLSSYLGAADGPLNRSIGRKVLIAAVRRARVPGTKFDQIMVWEGPQGSGKSSAIKILAGGFFSDAEIIGQSGREVMELCGGVWLYEISELEGLGKRDVAHVKAFVSRTHDKARPAYGYATVEQGRTCVFIGSTNGTDYLADETGNRRFWPVSTGKIDLAALERDRDQLWAEAATAEATGEALVIDPALWSEAAARADARLPPDPWEDILASVEAMPNAAGSIEQIDGEIRVASEFLLGGVLCINRAQVRVSDSKRLAAVMKRLGWTGPKPLRIGEKVAKGYVRRVAVCRGR